MKFGQLKYTKRDVIEKLVLDHIKTNGLTTCFYLTY